MEQSKLTGSDALACRRRVGGGKRERRYSEQVC